MAKLPPVIDKVLLANKIETPETTITETENMKQQINDLHNFSFN